MIASSSSPLPSRARRSLAAAVLCLASCALRPVSAPPATNAPASKRGDTVKALAQPLVDGEWVAGLAIGLVEGDAIETYGFGRRTDASPVPPDAHTAFEIGSISKVFTALVLAESERRGLVRLDTPVAELLGPAASVPARGGRAITLADLATHTSGLPRMPDNFSPADSANPYASYDAGKLEAFLQRYSLKRAPGEKYEYSNLGFGLLGHALARRAGVPYGQLVHDWVIAPLGMTSTGLDAPSGAALATAACGHDDAGEPVAPWTFDVFAPAGAIRSTAQDMSAFVRANLDPPRGGLGESILAAQRFRVAREGGGIGLGWHIGLDAPTLTEVRWHNGQTAGFHTFVGFDRERRVGVVVLANSAQMAVDKLGATLLLLLRGEPYALKLPSVVPVSAAVLDRYVGQYQLAPGAAFTVTRRGSHLFAQLTGQPAFRVYPETQSRFRYRIVDAVLDFETGGEGEVRGLVLHQNGRDLPAAKVN